MASERGAETCYLSFSLSRSIHILSGRYSNHIQRTLSCQADPLARHPHGDGSRTAIPSVRGSFVDDGEDGEDREDSEDLEDGESRDAGDAAGMPADDICAAREF